MSEQPLLPIAVQPVISYPHEAEVGKTYLMTIDLQVVEGSEWQFEEEEYPIYCVVDSEPWFKCQSIGEPAIVLHRFGGTYGVAKFLLTVPHQKMLKGDIKVSLINAWGIPVKLIQLSQIDVNREISRIYPLQNWMHTDREIESEEKISEESQFETEEPLPNSSLGDLFPGWDEDDHWDGYLNGLPSQDSRKNSSSFSAVRRCPLNIGHCPISQQKRPRCPLGYHSCPLSLSLQLPRQPHLLSENEKAKRRRLWDKFPDWDE